MCFIGLFKENRSGQICVPYNLFTRHPFWGGPAGEGRFARPLRMTKKEHMHKELCLFVFRRSLRMFDHGPEPLFATPFVFEDGRV
jgi:hypothetical protein